MFIGLQNPGLALEAAPGTGSLIVTYQTDPQGERLERIRFWLKDANGRQHLYPKEQTQVADSQRSTRMVVIEDLLPGEYSVEFLVPNIDDYFVEVPPRQIIIIKGDVAKIDQKIIPKDIYKGSSEPPKEDSAGVLPQKTPKEEVKKEEGLPSGKLIVSYDVSSQPSLVKNIVFKLIDSKGNATLHPNGSEDTEIPLTVGNMVVVANVSPGEYSLEFFVKGEPLQTLDATKTFLIDAGKTKSFHQSLTALPPVKEQEKAFPLQKEQEKVPPLQTGFSLKVNANIPTAVFYLESQEGTESIKGKGRLHTFENLKPGTYQLFFDSYDPFFDPPQEMHVEVGENQKNEVEGIFDSLGKLKILANEDNSKVTISDINRKQEPVQLDLREGIGVVYLPEGEYRLTFSKPESGRLPPQPMDIVINALQTKEVNVFFSASRGD